jgi:hypothetical protein
MEVSMALRDESVTDSFQSGRQSTVIIENSVRTHEPSDWKTVLRCFKLTWILDQLLSESQIGECK